MAPPPSVPFTYFNRVHYLSRKESHDGFTLQRIWTYQPTKKTASALEIFANYVIFPILSSVFLLKNLRKFSTVIVATPPVFILLIVPLIRLYKKKLVIDVGDLPVEIYDQQNSRKYRLVKKSFHNFQIKCWKKADLIVTNSQIIKKEIQKLVIDPEKITYFPFNVDSNIFRKYDVQRENVIVFTGMISPVQNLEVFINSMTIITKKFPDLMFEIYGWGKSEEKIKKLITELKLQKNCKINKPIKREKIPEILSKSIAGLIPLDIHSSLRYLMPTKAFEYMSCGLPIFAYGSSEELEENIQKSKSGKFVKSNEAEELARSFIEFLNDKNSLEKYSLNGRKFIENETKYSDLINKL